MVSDAWTELRRDLDSGALSSESLAAQSIQHVEAMEPKLHAMTFCDKDRTLELARAADARLQNGERGPMLGIPIVLKDNLHWKGAPVGNGSHITRGYQAPYNATVVDRLLKAGAIPIGKAAMDEFAMGSSGEFCASGPTRNPWDLDRVPGGSSSGSIVSVAAGYAPFALGSDTGGSVRLPGSFCNITALRPTYGVLSRFGVTAMASSLDQVGPVARSAKALAAGFSVIAGQDPMDATSANLPEIERLQDLKPLSIKGLRIGIPREYFGEGIAPAIRSVLQSALDRLAAEGAELVEVSLPHTSYAIETYYLICTSEVSSNMSRYDGVRFGARENASELGALISETRDQGFGSEVKRRILLGTFCLSKGCYDAFYLKALKTRTLITKDFTDAFQRVDVLATPVSPTLPFRLGEKLQDPMAMYLADVFTVTPALAALPCMSVPAGFAEDPATSRPLPVGLQLIGPHLSDVRLLELAHTFQQMTEHHLARPLDLASSRQ
jgi:aspartyl-tRNA(Asn)/glutamyl-tRNA(Gln) amidotransferase subunit A